MYLRDFQITMRRHDFEQFKQARLVWEPIELRICHRIPKRFLFGYVKKVVVQVGPEPVGTLYQMMLDVGVLHYPEFNMETFLKTPEKKQVAATLKIVRESFAQLSERFKTPVPWVFEELDELESEQA